MECTGGSTGSALAFVSAALGLEFCAVFSDAFSKSKQLTMEAFGEDLIVGKSFWKGIPPELIQCMKKKSIRALTGRKFFLCGSIWLTRCDKGI